MIRCVIVLVFTLAAGCGSCHGKPAPDTQPPAGRHEIDLVNRALGGDYRAALAELEKQPAAGLRALRELSGPPHSKRALYLAVIADHLQHIDQYHQWQKQLEASAGPGPYSPLGPTYSNDISGMSGGDHVYFWGEKLIDQSGELARSAAIAHLERIGGPVAGDLIAMDARPSGGRNFQGRASDALARMGRGRDIAEAVAELEHSSIAPSAVEIARGTLKGSLRLLGPDVRAKTENELLTALEKEPLTPDQRAGYLIVLGTIGSSAAADRLEALRPTPWGQQMKAQLDAASAQILAREDDTPKGSAKP